MNSAPKMASMDKIKQHRHVKFVPPEPILFDPTKYAPRKIKKKKSKKNDLPKDDPTVTIDGVDDISPEPEEKAVPIVSAAKKAAELRKKFG